MNRSVADIRETGAAWVTESELEGLCQIAEKWAYRERAWRLMVEALADLRKNGLTGSNSLRLAESLAAAQEAEGK